MNWESDRSTFDRRRLAAGIAASIEGGWSRRLAVGSSVVLLWSFLSVPYFVTSVVGGTAWLALFVAGALLFATVLAVVVPDDADLPVGIAVGLATFLLGLGGYLLLIPDVYYALFTVGRVTSDTIALLTGQSVLLLLDADMWAIGIAPGPAFLTWYLVLRRHYELSAIAGGITLGFFALTGDSGTTTTLLGMTGALGTLGFGSLDRWSGTASQVQDLGLVLIGGILASRALDIVPNRPAGSNATIPQVTTLEGSLVGTPGQVPIVGSISLSPEERFTVEADAAAYWRVASYDRYTGQGWISTADARSYDGPLPGPPGDARQVIQEFTLSSSAQAMPAAWKPVFVGDGRADDTVVLDDGGLRPDGVLSAGDSYRVISRVPQWSEQELVESVKEYPSSVRERYLQLPSSTPRRLAERAESVTSDAGSPFESVLLLRDWLKSTKAYSLQVSRVQDNVADRFVFDFDRGYCVHFATALTVMLRTIGIPARFVVGYTPGERVGERRYLVRGLHSHAWTEVFFPETGWIAVDPTPAGPRRRAENEQLVSDRPRATVDGPLSGDDGSPNGNTAGDNVSSGGPGGRLGVTPTPGPDIEDEERSRLAERNLSRATDVPGGRPTETYPGLGMVRGNQSIDTTTPADSGRSRRGGDGGERLTLLVGAVGLALGAYRVGILKRAYRSIWVRRQSPSGSPKDDVELALERLEYVLSRAHRERQPDETARAYVRAIEDETDEPLDARVHRVVDLYERVRFSERSASTDAREAVALVDDLVEEL